MAANYKVNIELDTSKLDAQLKDLGVKVDAVGKTRAGTSRKVLTEEEKIKREQEKQLNESIKILQAKNATASSTNKALRLERKGAQTKEEIKRLTEIEQDLNAQNLKSQKIEKLNADYQLKLQQREIEGQKKETVVAEKNVKVEDTGRKILKEKVKLLGQAVKLRQIGSRFGALGADLDALTAPITRGPGGNMLALPSSEMLADRVSATGQRGGFVGSSGGGGFAGMGSMFSGFDRGSALSSATISGAFPLLFGQGPVSALGGAIGGGLGGGFGGQMGGFAGGLAGTTIATGVAQFTASVADLGKALNENTKDVGALSEALGITGTEFEKNLKTLEKLGGEEAAFEAARNKMINLVGQKGVDALSKFGEGATELANEFTIAMTQMKASFASAFGDTGIGQGISNRLKAANLQRQAAVSKDPEVIKARELATALGKGPLWRTKEEKELIKANPNTSYFDALKGVETAQVGANERSDKAAQEKILADIQAQRVEDIDKEIALLERGAGMSVMEFEIETKIMEIKKDGAIQDEDAIRSKLEKLYKLQEEREAVEKINDLYKDIGSTIKDGMLEGINAVIDGTKTLGDVASNVLRQISNKLISFGLDTLLGGIPGLGSMFKADGGPVKGGSSYIVGERGPELFVPGSSGSIVPNHKLGKGGGSTSIVVNVDASGSSVEGEEEDSRELGNMLAAAIQTELVRQQRPGGLLA